MSKIKERSLQEISDFIGGEIEGHENPKDFLISSLAVSPETSTIGDLALVFDSKYFKQISTIKAKAIILPKDAKDGGKLPKLSCPVIWATRPRLVLKKLLELFGEPRFTPKDIDSKATIDSSSKVASNCKIGANAFVGPNCLIDKETIIYPNVYIGKNVKIGQNCILYPNCTILDECQIGNNVILHSGVVIGSDGYSYVTEEESNLEKAKRGDSNFNFGRQIQYKIQSIGNVIVEDDVEIGANSCVDRGTIGSTVIGAGTKIDNLVQIAHNCKIGKDCLIVGQVGFAGSVQVGDRVVAGGQSGFADNIEIGNDVIFAARAAVHGDIPSNSVYMGFPAVPYQEYFKNERSLKRLPRKYEKLEQQVKELEDKVKELEGKLGTSLRGSETTKAISFRE